MQPGTAFPTPEKNNPKTIFGWCMYDWSNSAYITTAVGLLPIFFADAVVGPTGADILGHHFRADTLWGFTVGLAGVLSFVFAPVLGAISDFSSAKKKFLLSFAYSGALFTLFIYFCHSGDVVKTLAFFLVSQLGFVNANVFYDAFLPQIASEDHLDRVSTRGYAFGYVGGGLQFAIALLIVAFAAKLGITKEHAARIGIAMSGFWWAGFTLITWKHLHEPPAKQPIPQKLRRIPEWMAYLRIGVERTWETTKRVRRFRHLLLFLLAFMLYNEGIQTVINMATSYGAVELHLSATAMMLTLLIIQFVAIFGSYIFGALAERVGTRPAIVVSLVIWMGVVIYAYFITSATEFFILGMIVGIAIGGSQALSRSYYGSMVPVEASAEFFGFYTVFTKFSSIWGPWAFALITHFAHSGRTAIVSLIVFFVFGLGLLLLVDEEKARGAREFVVAD
jgi:MFS transporter, UMF1 family